MLPPLGHCLAIVPCPVLPINIWEMLQARGGPRLPGHVDHSHIGLWAARIDWNASLLPSLASWLFALPARVIPSALPSLLGTLAADSATTVTVGSSSTLFAPHRRRVNPPFNPVDNTRT